MTRGRKQNPVAIERRDRLPVGPGIAPLAQPEILDFGHHAGRTIEELTRIDPDYLVWLASHPSGARFRADIERALDRSAAESQPVRANSADHPAATDD